MEREFIDPGGLLCRLEESVKELASKKGSSEVTMGGVSFRDQPSTEGLASLLGDQEVISCGFDMVVQMLALLSSLTTSAVVTKASADAIKAGDSSTTAADTTTSFHCCIPRRCSDHQPSLEMHQGEELSSHQPSRLLTLMMMMLSCLQNHSF